MTKPRGILADGALRETGTNLSVLDAVQHSLSEIEVIVLWVCWQVTNYHSSCCDQGNDWLVWLSKQVAGFCGFNPDFFPGLR